MIEQPGPLTTVTGYVLAGGRSTRMGQDKALLDLGGRPLIESAVNKLRKVACEVRILSNRPELAAYAPLVPDLRESCGPLGGLEAALSDARSDWILVLPVDMPFVPSTLLKNWASEVLRRKNVRIAMFAIDGVRQPALCLLHRDVAPYLTSAAQRSMLKLYPAFEQAARELTLRNDVPFDDILLVTQWNDGAAEELLNADARQPARAPLSPAQREAVHLWFANLNTPEEFSKATGAMDALDWED